jgi:hypothetical protein
LYLWEENIMKKVSKSKKIIGTSLMSLVLIASFPLMASAHCDTMEGPTVADGYKAIENNNVNYVMKWVGPQYEKEITDKFNLTMKVKDLSPEAKQLAEQYFFSEVIRVHRAGENAPFDGLKPVGTPIDEKVKAADESIAVGNLSPLEGMIEQDKMPELKERFEKVMSLKDFDVNNLEEGREYIEAYVKFFKFAEGEEEGHGESHSATHGEDASQTAQASQAEEEATSANHNPKTGDLGVLPYLAASAVTGLGALALRFKRESK